MWLPVKTNEMLAPASASPGESMPAMDPDSMNMIRFSRNKISFQDWKTNERWLNVWKLLPEKST